MLDIVANITVMFRERALLILHYGADDEMKKTRYHDMLRDGI